MSNKDLMHNNIALISEAKFLPMINTLSFDVLKRSVDLCVDCGISYLEVLNRNANTLTLFKKLVDFRDEYHPSFQLLAGTITDSASAELFIEAGASMIIAPNVDKEISMVCQDYSIEWLPGISTVSEAYKATKHGAAGLKLFPANLINPSLIQILKSLIPQVKIVASGGILLNNESVSMWINNGADAVAFGSHFFTADILTNEGAGVMINKLKTEINRLKKNNPN